MKQKLLIILSIFSINTTLFAQLKVQGIIRPRFEIRNGYGTLRNDTTTPAAFVSQRTRLNFSYKKDKIETKFSLFDFRVWGNQVWKNDKPMFGLHEAWAKYNINDKFSVKFGRQELKYDNSRLISAVNWNQVGAAHDVIFIKYKYNKWTADFIAGWNQSNQNKFGTDYNLLTQYYKSLNVFWVQKKMKLLTISSLNILDGNQDLINAEKINFRLTSGIKVDMQKIKYKVVARMYVQQGKLQTQQKVNAFFGNIDFIYKVSSKIKLDLGSEIKSGNNASDTTNTESNSFDILYGARHKLNGRIGYFNTAASTKGAGLIDIYLKATYKFAKKINLLTEYHYFALQNNYIYNSIVIDNFLAHEIDFVFDRKLAENVKIQAGYSMIFGSKTLEIIKEGNAKLFNNWFYLMITIDPTIFKSNNN